MIVADLVATLTLDDQMSVGLAKAGQQLDTFASKTGKVAGEAIAGSQRQSGQPTKAYEKAAADAYGNGADLAARYSQGLADASAAAADLGAAQTAATAVGNSLAGLTKELGQLAAASDSATASLSALSGVLREITTIPAPERGEGSGGGPAAQDPWEIASRVANYLAILEFIPTKILPTIAKRVLGGVGSAIILAYETNFLGFADAADEALTESEIVGDTVTVRAATGQIVVDAATWANPAVKDSLLEAAAENNIGDKGPYDVNSGLVQTWAQRSGYGAVEDNRAAASQIWSDGAGAMPGPRLAAGHGADYSWLDPLYDQAETERLIKEEFKARMADFEFDQWITEWNRTGGRQTELEHVYGNAATSGTETIPAPSGTITVDAATWGNPAVRDSLLKAAAENNIGDTGPYDMNSGLAQTWDQSRGYSTLEDNRAAASQLWSSGTASDLTTGAMDIQATAVTVTAQTTNLDNAGPLAMPEPLPGTTNTAQTDEAIPSPGLGGVPSPEMASAGGMGTQLVMQWAAGVVAEIQAAAPQVVAQIQQALSAVMSQAMSGGAMAAGSVPGAAGTTALPSPGLGGAPIGGLPTSPGAGAPATGGEGASMVQGVMQGASQALTTGISQLQTQITTSMSALATSISTGMSTAATAVQGGTQAIIAAVNSIGPALSAAAASAAATAGTIGDGIVAALDADVGAVQAAAGRLAAAAETGIDGVVQPGSPSRMAIPYGQSIGEGLAFGMQQKSPEVLAAAEKLGYSAEQGLQPLMDGMSMTGLAAGKALGVDMEQALAQQVNGMEGWDPKSQIDHEALLAFQDAAVKMARYGKRAGDEAATKAGEAFKGLADNMSAVLMGSETYLSDELAKDALMSYRKLDAEAKKKLPDGIKEQLKSTYDEANITIGDVIKQRMEGAGMDRLQGGGFGAMFKERKEMILRGMLGQRTLEQKAQAAAEDGLSLAIDSIKNGLMQGGQDAQSAMKGAIDSALGGGPGEAMKGGMLESMFGGAGGGADPEEFAWALCECISGANQEMLGSLGLGNPAETATAMLGHELSNQIAGTGDEFRGAMLDYAKQNPALNLPTQWLEDETASQCMNICDKAASEMGGAAGDAAGAAMGAKMPAMPSGADFGKAAGGALGSQMQSQCVSLCGGSTDDLASGVANGVADAGIGEMAAKDATLQMGAQGARELGKSLRSGIPGATSPAMPGATPDDMASGVADGMSQQCISLCDDSGMSNAASSLDSAAGGMSDLGGQISQLTQSLVSQKFGETMKGIQDGLSGGGGGTGGIPSGVEVPDHILKLNPNINRALNFDIAQTNPHAAALLGGASPIHLQGVGTGGGGTPSGFQNDGEQTINVNLNVDGEKLASTSVKYMGRGLGLALNNARRGGGSMMGSRRG